jgi:hypothetical protein
MFPVVNIPSDTEIRQIHATRIEKDIAGLEI